MFSAVSAVTVRRRRLILTIAVAVAVALAVGRRLSHLLDAILGGVSAIAVLVLMSLSLLGLHRRRPAALLIEPAVRAFATVPSASQIYLAMGFTFLASLALETGGASLIIAIPYLVLVGINVVAAWRGVSVQLQPDGIHQRDAVGSLSVPWEALAPGKPARPAVNASVLPLTYARPELVHRRGIVPSRRWLRIDGIHAWFIADAIRHYVDHPEHRAAIGEPAEYQRLWQALTYPSTAPGQRLDS